MKEIRLLSVRQPWAWALFNGKDVENRSWSTEYRGLLAIHAGLQLDADALAPPIEAALEWTDCGDQDDHRGPFDGFSDAVDHRGKIIGVVEMVGCIRSQDSKSSWAQCWEGGPSFCFELQLPVELPEPIPYKGQLGLGKLPEHLALGLMEIWYTEMERRIG